MSLNDQELEIPNIINQSAGDEAISFSDDIEENTEHNFRSPTHISIENHDPIQGSQCI